MSKTIIVKVFPANAKSPVFERHVILDDSEMFSYSSVESALRELYRSVADVITFEISK